MPMDQEEFDLNDLYQCCKRELAMRRRVYPKWVMKGMYTPQKAADEILKMRKVCDYFIDEIFRQVTRQADPRPRPPAAPEALERNLNEKMEYLRRRGEKRLPHASV